MFELLLGMYVEGKIRESYLKKAVRAGWITQEEKEEIINFKKEVDNVETNS